MVMPLIPGCACGSDHGRMPTDEDGTPLVCVTHRKHEPCRSCLWDESGAVSTQEYLAWLRKGDDDAGHAGSD